MTFTTEKIEPDIAIIRGDEKLNMVTAPELRESVRRSISGGNARIVVDLSAITFMDSSGLGALVGCLKSARQAGGDLRIAAPSKQVTMVLQLSNLDRVLAKFDTPYDAYHD
ncbi:STAS domain-containing protein [Cryobacterium sp. PH31-AA6]|uniref:STAS domain-containing protein n=1 Tax=Cryobacterium sp. PH31-AA6 TaxID=3046205 RepID=UPI0024B9B9B8|nr:STAS domain-containing protein [Cryobacterium sp. PH31-AA6]MDJ0325480.1 STAS domain-containing protein [Cryobacterium sp. PH31-AA6]